MQLHRILRHPSAGKAGKLELFLTVSLIIGACFGCKTPSILVTREQQLGDHYNNLYEYDQALVHYGNMLEASSGLGTYRNLDMEADVHRKMAHAYSVQGRYGEALGSMESAFALDSLQGNSLEIIEDLREMGKIHLYTGAFPEGIGYLQRALSQNEGMEQSLKGSSQTSIADTYLTLSRLHLVLGDFSQGELDGLKALTLYRSVRDPEGEMESLLQLGRILIQAGSENRGEGYVRSSLSLAMELGVNTYRHKEALARLSENRAQYEEVLRFRLEVLNEVKELHNLPRIIWALMLTGDLYGVLGDQQNAREYYQDAIHYLDSSQISASALDASANLRAGEIDQAYAYFSEAGSAVAAGIASMRLGEVALEWNQWEEARGHFQVALDHFSSSSLRDGMARALILSAVAEMNLGDTGASGKNLDRAGNLVRYDETSWRLSFTRGNLYEKLSRPDSAIAAYKAAVEIIERIRGNLSVDEYKSMYLEDKMDVYDRLIRLLMEGGRIEESLNYSEKARARTFLEMLGRGRMEIRPDASAILVELEQKLRQEIQSMVQLAQKSDLNITRGLNSDRIEEEIFNTREEYNEVMRELKLYNQEYSSIVDLETQDVSDLMAQIDPETAFLAYWVSEEYLYIWMVTSGGIISRTVEIDESEIYGMVTDARRSVNNRDHAAVLGRCYDLLIRPLEEELRPFSTIGIIPHLPLHFLPFQCLMPDEETYLIDRFGLFFCPSLNVYSVSLNKEVHPEKEILAMAIGGMELGELPGLPGTTGEVSRIGLLFPDATTVYEDSSTETFFKSNVQPYEYVHLATHGVLDQIQPMFSYMALAPTENDDGMLTVNEIFGLEMNADLVVLSACETGLGTLSRADEIIGLSRAFLYAGSRDVVVSLWSVADEPTAYLMTQFYANLPEFGSVGSLRMAQISTRERYGLPFQWAPFQIIGSGR